MTRPVVVYDDHGRCAFVMMRPVAAVDGHVGRALAMARAAAADVFYQLCRFVVKRFAVATLKRFGGKRGGGFDM